MKILLINPPTTHIKGSGKPTLNVPLGILYIAAVIERFDYDVEIYDTKINFKIRHEGKYTIFGDSWDIIKKKIEKINPDVVGISNPFTVYLENALKIAEIVKKINKKIPVIIGGPHASVSSMDFLKNKNIDFVVMREGEYTFLNIIKHLEGKKKIKEIKNIGYKLNEKCYLNSMGDFIKNLDELPFPAYHLVGMKKYFNSSFSPRSEYTNRAISMITSRGCPFNCIFCSIHLHMGKIWRSHSTDYILKHIKFLVDNYKIKLIHFEDDNFTLDKKRFEKILDGIIENNIKIKWDTPNGVRVDTLDENLLVKSKKSGCQYLIIGVESGNQKVLDTIINKSLNLEKVIEIAKICKKIKLDLEAFFVVGLPGETKKNIIETFEFAKMLNKKYDVFPSFHIAAPLLNTKLYEICKKKGYLTKTVNPKTLLTVHQGKSIIKTQDFSPEELEIIFKKYKNFIRITRIKKALKHPYLIKSYFIKQISKTSFFSFIKN